MKLKTPKAPRASKPKLRAVTGYVIYRGPSLINGAPIVAVAVVSKSSNGKTGAMVQTYILADNGQSAVVNAQQLADEAICGTCPARRGLGGHCYVNLGQGPRAVTAKLIDGGYPAMSPADVSEVIKGRPVRLGTYGDPAAVPAKVWSDLLIHSSGHTGYSHQWQSGVATAEHMVYLMASADSAADRALAVSKGYRTFRVIPIGQAPAAGEFACPASAEAGKRKTCATCLACDGGLNTRKASPAIQAHGSLKGRFKA